MMIVLMVLHLIRHRTTQPVKRQQFSLLPRNSNQNSKAHLSKAQSRKQTFSWGRSNGKGTVLFSSSLLSLLSLELTFHSVGISKNMAVKISQQFWIFNYGSNPIYVASWRFPHLRFIFSLDAFTDICYAIILSYKASWLSINWFVIVSVQGTNSWNLKTKTWHATSACTEGVYAQVCMHGRCAWMCQMPGWSRCTYLS